MEQMTVTAKIQISVNADSKVFLDETMSVYSDAQDIRPSSKIRKSGFSHPSKNHSMTLFGTEIIPLHKTAFQ